MAYVVCEPCRKCEQMSCVKVCPVESFHEDTNRLVIDPQACIDCGACSVECPFNAIFADDEVPAKWKDFIEFNAVGAQRLPGITEPKIS